MLAKLIGMYWMVMAPCQRVFGPIFVWFREFLKKIVVITLAVGVLFVGWYFFSKKPELPLDTIKAQAVPLINALETYHETHAVYPATVRDALSGLDDLKFGFIYEGVDPEAAGFRSYKLYLGGHPKAFIYLSSTKAWKKITVKSSVPEILNDKSLSEDLKI